MKNDILDIQHPIYKIVKKVAEGKQIESFAVGGVVRDLFLNRFSTDIDILVIGNGIELAKEVAKEISPSLKVNVFKNFGTAQIVYKDAAIEFVGARKESYTYNSRKPTVEKGTLEEDLARRDFTINAMAIGISGERSGELIDLFNGFDDLQDKILRTPLDPDNTFSDDPLRMLRAVRFASQLEFKIDQKTFAAIKKNAHRLEIISKERIVGEFNKILLSKKPSTGIMLCQETGMLVQFLPELYALKGVEMMNGRGHKDNYLHTLQVVDRIALVNSNLWLLWAALLHDIAKPKTKKYDEKVGWSFHGHEYLGSKMVKRIFNQLKMPANGKMKYVQKMVALHLRPIALVEDEITDSAVRRLLFDAGDDIEDLMLLCEADVTSSVPEKIKRCMKNFANVRQKLKEIEEKDRIRNWQPPIAGEMIMSSFGLSPCREVGIIKDAIKEAILEGKISNEFEDAYEMMLEEGKKLNLKVVKQDISKGMNQKKIKKKNLDRKIKPPINEVCTSSLKLPQYYLISKKTPLYLFQNEKLELIHVLIKVKAGALYESDKLVAKGTYGMLKDSSARFSAKEMDDFLAFHGASWKTNFQLQYITIQWVIPKKNLEILLPLLWETIYKPTYKVEDLQRFKEYSIKDLEYNSAKFNYRAYQLMFAEMFPDNMPIGNILSKEHINALTVELLQDYHKQTFTESNIRVFVAGNVEGYDSYFQFAQCPKEIGSKEDFDIIQCLKKESRKDELVSRKDCKVRFELRESALQSSLILCKNNIGFLHENRRNFEVLSMIYGGYFGSRLMKNLREEKGYTYNVFCNSIFYENKALFYIEADVIVEKTKEAIETCYKEMLLLQNELVDENELSLVKSYMLGELLRSVDGYVDYQKRYALWNDFGLDEKEMQMMVDSIRAVTSQNIQTLAKLYLVPETFTTVVVGKM